MIPKPAVSVTVPVYNTAKYLHKCLESLSAQTLKNIEFIVVDDGSTDNSGTICDEFAENDSRFKVIHQVNSGLAAARQAGLDAASGEYIIVCDSDDWAEPEMYEKLYEAAKSTDADIVICGYYKEYENRPTLKILSSYKETNGIVDNYDLINFDNGTSWVKLIKRTLFEKTVSKYEIGINLSEDALILYKLMRGNPKIIQIEEPLYHYRRLFGENTYTNNISMNGIRQLHFTYNWLKDNYPQKEYETLARKRAIDLAFACIRCSDLDSDFFRNFFSSELNWRRLLMGKLTLKSIFVCIEKILPIKYSRIIFKIFYPVIYK